MLGAISHCGNRNKGAFDESGKRELDRHAPGYLTSYSFLCSQSHSNGKHSGALYFGVTHRSRSPHSTPPVATYVSCRPSVSGRAEFSCPRVWTYAHAKSLANEPEKKRDDAGVDGIWDHCSPDVQWQVAEQRPPTPARTLGQGGKDARAARS